MENCVGCGRCLGACNFDAIGFDFNAAVEMLNRRMAEYTKAVVDGRPCFHISLVVDVSPNCDCHGENDVPILPNLGMFASFDPLALDQACVDACLQADPLPGSQLTDNMAKRRISWITTTILPTPGPRSEWRTCLSARRKNRPGDPGIRADQSQISWAMALRHQGKPDRPGKRHGLD